MTILKTVCGIEISVTDDGKFSAKIGRDTITRKDLKSVEAEIGKRATGEPVKLMSVTRLDQYSSPGSLAFEKQEVVAYDKTASDYGRVYIRFRLAGGGTAPLVYPCNPFDQAKYDAANEANRVYFEEVAMARAKRDAVVGEIVESLPILSTEDVMALIDAQKK